MQVAVFRYLPTSEYKQIDGVTWERQHKDLVEIVEGDNLVKVAKAYPAAQWTLAFEEVR